MPIVLPLPVLASLVVLVPVLAGAIAWLTAAAPRRRALELPRRVDQPANFAV